MQLYDMVQAYYFSHLDALPPAKRFHFCSRLAAWKGETAALATLRALRPVMVPSPLSHEALRTCLETLLNTAPHHVNATALRAPYFKQFPNLYGLELALFRVHHWEAVYGIDGRSALLDLVPRDQLFALKEELIAQPDALRILSSYAVNFIYLLERVLGDAENQPIAFDTLAALGNGYDTNRSDQLQLYLYCYTHAIIGETIFYARAIPPAVREQYVQLLTELDSVISKHFDRVTVDAMLEFLVCCRICGYKSGVQTQIEQRCVRSVSPEGTFLIDHALPSEKNSFERSEHRNVLYIMSQTPYAPQPVRQLLAR